DGATWAIEEPPPWPTAFLGITTTGLDGVGKIVYLGAIVGIVLIMAIALGSVIAHDPKMWPIFPLPILIAGLPLWLWLLQRPVPHPLRIEIDPAARRVTAARVASLRIAELAARRPLGLTPFAFDEL